MKNKLSHIPLLLFLGTAPASVSYSMEVSTTSASSSSEPMDASHPFSNVKLDQASIDCVLSGRPPFQIQDLENYKFEAKTLLTLGTTKEEKDSYSAVVPTAYLGDQSNSNLFIPILEDLITGPFMPGQRLDIPLKNISALVDNYLNKYRQAIAHCNIREAQKFFSTLETIITGFRHISSSDPRYGSVYVSKYGFVVSEYVACKVVHTFHDWITKDAFKFSKHSMLEPKMQVQCDLSSAYHQLSQTYMHISWQQDNHPIFADTKSFIENKIMQKLDSFRQTITDFKQTLRSHRICAALTFLRNTPIENIQHINKVVESITAIKNDANQEISRLTGMYSVLSEQYDRQIVSEEINKQVAFVETCNDFLKTKAVIDYKRVKYPSERSYVELHISNCESLTADNYAKLQQEFLIKSLMINIHNTKAMEGLVKSFFKGQITSDALAPDQWKPLLEKLLNIYDGQERNRYLQERGLPSQHRVASALVKSLFGFLSNELKRLYRQLNEYEYGDRYNFLAMQVRKFEYFNYSSRSFQNYSSLEDLVADGRARSN